MYTHVHLSYVWHVHGMCAQVLERCYPYTTLNNLDFLETPGFIAGTTNPIFESHPEWWDVLCDIDSGRVLVRGRRHVARA